MEPMKNLCGLIPESLHKRLMEGKSPEMTNGEYLTKILTTYLDQPATAKQEQRTLAVQISDDMFQRLKSYLDAHAPLTQKALVQSLLNQALDQWEHGEEPLQSAALQDNKKERTLAIATSILDFLRYAIRYFLMGQQTYAWGLYNPTNDRSDKK